jgi:putative ABC transport system substrate-binding protein
LYGVAKAAGVEVIEAPADNKAELEAWFAAREKMDDIGIDAIIMIPEPLDGFAPISAFAYKHQLPFGGAYNNQDGLPPIFGFMPNNIDVGKLAAPLADKIFKGTPAGTLPVVSPEGYLIVDVKAAKALGVTVPEGLLRLANEIVR